MDEPMLQATTSSLTSVSTSEGTSTKETTNYARLCRLLIDVGSQALRDIFNSIHPPGSLQAVLEANRPTLQRLRSRRVLNATQWSKLYPAIATSVSSANFDITLIFVLIRNICGLNPPATTGSWDILPPTRDLSGEADIIRLKFFRNDIYAHVERASLSDSQFASHWQKIRETLMRLGGKSYEIAINNLETESIDPEMELHYKKVLEEWKKDEDNVKDMLNEIRMEVGNVSQKVDDLAAAVVPNKGNVTIKIVVEVDRVTFKDTKQWDPAQQEEVRRKLMSELSKTFFETKADKIAIEDIPTHLRNYLECVLDLPIVTAMEGSLILTVHCRTLEILEHLWKEYCSGHLNAVAEKCFMTDDIQDRFDVDSITLKTTILKEEYLACKLSLMDLELAEEEMAALVPHEEELMETDTADNSVGEQLASGEGAKSGGSLKITVKCQTLEGLEKLWSDYCSGHLTSVAQEYLVTDDLKEKLGVESLKLKTVISKEDYLKCKQYLLNRAGNSTDQSSSPATSTENLLEDKGATSLRKSDDDGNDKDCSEQSVEQDEEKMI